MRLQALRGAITVESNDSGAILSATEELVQAVLDRGDGTVTARIVVQVRPGEQFAAERELRRLVKKRFDSATRP